MKGGHKMNKNWWKAAGIRSLRTFAQTAIATIGTTAVIEQVNWAVVSSASVLAALLSLLTSIASLPEINTELERNDDDRSDDAPNFEEEDDE